MNRTLATALQLSSPRSAARPRLRSYALIAAVATCAIACDNADDTGQATAANATYLVAQGTWLLDESEQSFSDARNPRRLVLATSDTPGSSSAFSFYADLAGREPLAVGCRYQYNRSQPDSYRFPASKEAIWVVFDLEPANAPGCEAYAKVAFLPTLAGDGRLHVRLGALDYGDMVGPRFSDPSSPELWWSIYRPLSGTRDAPRFPYEVANGERVLDREGLDASFAPPSQVTLTTSAAADSESRFVFNRPTAPFEVWADCNFQVRYTMPDPSAFPGDKLALWDAFEMTGANSGACQDFQRVVLFWTDEGRVLHLRYGAESFGDLLSQSLESGATSGWQARYCDPTRPGCADSNP